MSQREHNKQEKRARIMAAAQHIIEKEGIELLTMRYLAEVAGVSSKTPYNLFDSKTDILLEIMLQSLQPLETLDDGGNEGLCVAALLQLLESLLALSAEREAFFRSIHWSIMRSDDIEAKKAGRLTLDRLISEHVYRLPERGELKSDSDVQAISAHLGILLASVLGMWADSQLTLQETVAHTRHAWINCLLPHARGKALRYLRDNGGTNLLPKTRRKRRAKVA